MIPLSPATRLFIKSAKEEEVIKAGDYYTATAKKFKLDEGIIKSFFHAIRSGESVDTSDLDTAAAKKNGAAAIKAIKDDWKAHEVNKKQFEADEVAAKAAAAQAKQAAKDAVIKDKQESAQMLEIMLTDEVLVDAQVQLTETSLNTIKGAISEKFSFDENGIITVDPANLPTKEEYARAFATMTTMVASGKTVEDSASKAEAQVAFYAKTTLGESWVNLFSERSADLSRISKGVKVFETISAFKSKKAKRLFGLLDFTTSRALLEFKVTTAEAEGSAEKALEINMAAKKELYLQAVEVLDTKRNENPKARLTQAEAKKLVQEYKAGKGIKPPEKVKVVHVFHIDKKLKVIGLPVSTKDNVRLSILSFDFDGNRLQISKDGKNIDKVPLTGPDEELAKYLLDNASPPELTKDQKAAASKAEKEAAKAGKKKGKKASDDEQEEDPAPKAVVKSTGGTPAAAPAASTIVEDEDEDPVIAEEETETDDDADTTTAPAGDDDDDDSMSAPAGRAALADDDEE